MRLREEKKQNKNTKKTGNRANTTNATPVSVNSSNEGSYANVAREKNAAPKQSTSQQSNSTMLIQMFKESQQTMRDMFQAVFDKQNQMLQAIIQQNGL